MPDALSHDDVCELDAELLEAVNALAAEAAMLKAAVTKAMIEEFEPAPNQKAN